MGSMQDIKYVYIKSECMNSIHQYCLTNDLPDLYTAFIRDFINLGKWTRKNCLDLNSLKPCPKDVPGTKHSNTYLHKVKAAESTVLYYRYGYKYLKDTNQYIAYIFDYKFQAI